MKKITIAIDGFSSCGKSTMAKDLAREIGYIYIDSGAMYRAVTLYSMENGLFTGNDIDTEKLKEQIKDIHISFQLNPDTGRPDTFLNGVNVEKKIRTMEVSSRVSPAGNGKIQRHCNGRPRHRHYRLSGCRTENLRNGLSRNPRTAQI